MKADINEVAFDHVLRLASDLSSKDRFKIILKLLSTLNSSQIEDLLIVGERVLADILLEEDEALEEQVKFEYKEIKGSFYAYLRQMGKKRCNDYLGPMRFMPGLKYKLTHKLNKAVKVLSGLGLYFEEEKIYLKIQHLTPTQEVQSYLFYDRSDEDFPRHPQMSIEKIFSKKKWDIECLGLIAKGGTVQKTVLVSRSPLTESPVMPESATLKTLQEKRVLQVDVELPSDPNAQKLPRPNLEDNKLEIHQLQKTHSVIQVRKNFISQVVAYLEQWEALTQPLPSNLQWRLIRNDERIILCNNENEVIVEYNSSSQILTAQSAHGLLTWLQEIMFAVTTSEVATQEQQSIANRWLARLECVPKKDSSQLLAFLFSL